MKGQKRQYNQLSLPEMIRNQQAKKKKLDQDPQNSENNEENKSNIANENRQP